MINLETNHFLRGLVARQHLPKKAANLRASCFILPSVGVMGDPVMPSSLAVNLNYYRQKTYI